MKKYGYEEAFRLACEFRDKMLRELNNQGAAYTNRHGGADNRNRVLQQL